MRAKLNLRKIVLLVATIFSMPILTNAQTNKELMKTYMQFYDSIQYFNYYDQRGINQFETTKEPGTTYEGFRLRVGAGFTQQFQNLSHTNTATNNTTTNKLYPLQNGFMTAQANLMTDVQLGDGIRLNLTTYLSARHHNEAWVKGGYLQFDKLPFKGEFWDNLMKNVTIKLGHMEINYGDAHFRRPDGGQTLLSPFMEQNIIDAYATEIGGEVYYKKNGFFGMAAMTNGMIKGNIDSTYVTVQDQVTSRNPSVYFKAGFDKQLDSKLRIRGTASLYTNSSQAGSGLTLYGGDRTGSNYQNVMEKAAYGAALPASTAIAFSGRLNPSFSKKLTSMMYNALVKYEGIEVFGTYEQGYGRAKTEVASRFFNQIAVEGIYRFGHAERVYIGARYNTVHAKLAGFANYINVNRTAFAAGWFLTRSVLLKGEIVNQKYIDFPTADYRSGGHFKGFVVEAVVGF